MVDKRKRVSLRPKREGPVVGEPEDEKKTSGVCLGHATSISFDPAMPREDVTALLLQASPIDSLACFSESLRTLGSAMGSTRTPSSDGPALQHTRQEIAELLRRGLLRVAEEVIEVSTQRDTVTHTSFSGGEVTVAVGGREHALTFRTDAPTRVFNNRVGAAAAAAFMMSETTIQQIAEHLTEVGRCLLLGNELICTGSETYFVVEVETSQGHRLYIYDATGAPVRSMPSGGRRTLKARAFAALEQLLR